MKVDEVTVVSPVVQIIENAGETSNRDPLLNKEAKPATKPSPIDLAGQFPKMPAGLHPIATGKPATYHASRVKTKRHL